MSHFGSTSQAAARSPRHGRQESDHSRASSPSHVPSLNISSSSSLPVPPAAPALSVITPTIPEDDPVEQNVTNILVCKQEGRDDDISAAHKGSDAMDEDERNENICMEASGKDQPAYPSSQGLVLILEPAHEPVQPQASHQDTNPTGEGRIKTTSHIPSPVDAPQQDPASSGPSELVQSQMTHQGINNAEGGVQVDEELTMLQRDNPSAEAAYHLSHNAELEGQAHDLINAILQTSNASGGHSATGESPATSFKLKKFIGDTSVPLSPLDTVANRDIAENIARAITLPGDAFSFGFHRDLKNILSYQLQAISRTMVCSLLYSKLEMKIRQLEEEKEKNKRDFEVANSSLRAAIDAEKSAGECKLSEVRQHYENELKAMRGSLEQQSLRNEDLSRFLSQAQYERDVAEQIIIQKDEAIRAAEREKSDAIQAMRRERDEAVQEAQRERDEAVSSKEKVVRNAQQEKAVLFEKGGRGNSSKYS